MNDPIEEAKEMKRADRAFKIWLGLWCLLLLAVGLIVVLACLRLNHLLDQGPQ